MKLDLLHTPEGVRDIYNGECARKLVLQGRLRDVCALYGYQNIQTPSFEFFDVFNKERGSVASNEMFKFFDRYNNTLVLRPDMTPSIARTAAKYFSDKKLPLKLCYEGNTFVNYGKYYQGKLKETTSIGAELIGDASLNADYEIISMVVDCMKNVGLKEFQVEIGNVDFFKGLLEDAGISGDTEEQLVDLIQKKNYFGVEELLDSLNIDKKISAVLLELPQMFGSIEILQKAAGLTKNEKSLAAIDRLVKLYELLKITGYDQYITIDLGALSKHAYYTGLIFTGYTFGTGEPVVTGGRYDKLIGQFGSDKAAIGFSITVDTLMAAMNRQNIEIPVDISGALLVYADEQLQDAIKVADALRKQDINVNMLSVSNASEEDYANYAKESQLKYVIYYNHASTTGTKDIKIVNIKTTESHMVTVNDLLNGTL